MGGKGNRAFRSARFAIFAVAATAALGACAPTNTPEVTMSGSDLTVSISSADYRAIPVLAISNDMGGALPEYEAQYWSAAFAARDVAITGKCYSACTIWLKSACVTRNASLGFHHAIGVPPSHRDWDATTRWIASYYPPQIAQWFLSQARYSAAVVTLSGSEAIRMGARECAS